MKKLLFVPLAVVLSVATLYGQPTTKDDGLKFGVKFKPHYAKTEEVKRNQEYMQSTWSVFKPSLGVFAEYAFSPYGSGQVGLEYSAQGYPYFISTKSLFRI